MWSAAPIGFHIADGLLAIDGIVWVYEDIVEVGWSAFRDFWDIHSAETELIRNELTKRRAPP